MPRAKLIEELYNLVGTPGYLYVYAELFIEQNAFTINQLKEKNNYEILHENEMGLLIYLMSQNVPRDEYLSKAQRDKMNIKTKELLKKIHDSYNDEMIASYLLKKDTSSFDFKEPVIYGEESAFWFQYLEHAVIRYGTDDAWFTSNLGVSIQEISEVIRYIHKIRAKNLSIFMSIDFEAVDDKDKMLALSAILVFSKNELVNLFSLKIINKFLELFSVPTIDKNISEKAMEEYSETDSKFIFNLSDDYFIILSSSIAMCKSVYESPFYWMMGDKVYINQHEKNRGRVTEDLSAEFLSLVFGKENVHRGCKFINKKNQNKEQFVEQEADVLIISGSKAIIVQAKSKKFTSLSKSGDMESIRNDFKKAVQDAYNQAEKCCDCLTSSHYRLLCNDLSREIILSYDIHESFILCVTTDTYPVVGIQTDHFLFQDANCRYPIVLNIFELEIMCHYLVNSFDYIFYLMARSKYRKRVMRMSELSILAYHLQNKLYFEDNVNGVLIDGEFNNIFDISFPVIKGIIPVYPGYKEIMYKWRNNKFQIFLEKIKLQASSYVYDVWFCINSISDESSDTLVKLMEDSYKKSEADGKGILSSLTFGEFGITFAIGFKEKRKEVLDTQCIGNMSKYKLKRWVGIGFMQDIEKIDYIVYIDEFRNSCKNPIHNEKCFCGSGVKYKKCCGSLS